jgi:pimeloyl-ACP methyl ester carboxylesterase
MTDIAKDEGALTANDQAAGTWRSAELGTSRRLTVPKGELCYFDRGDGPVIVFAHGWLANANLWRKVVAHLAPRFRCVTLDLPFGSHMLPMPASADLSPTGCGSLIASAIAALGADDVTLVGNDSGGAYSQIAVASGAPRVARLVLNSCETPFDAFPPPPFDALPTAAADLNDLHALLGALRDPAARRSPLAYGRLIKHEIPQQVSDSYVLPCNQNREVLRDTAKVWSSARSEPVHDAGRRLMARDDLPILFAWSSEDSVFPLDHARRFAAEVKHGRLEIVTDAYAFTPEDQPRQLADIIARFIGTAGL